MSSPSTEVECAILHETDDAILIEVAEEEFWIPFSQITRIVRRPNGPSSITMSEWIATVKGIL